MTYRESPSQVPGVVLWQRLVEQPATTRILPDGCLDLVWDGSRLFVAGPDTRARRHTSEAGASYAALRFSGGTGPALLGVPADELRDTSVPLADLWPAAQAAGLVRRVADDPAAALEQWVLRRAADRVPDPVGPAVLALAAAGTPVADMADRLGLGQRQLHRRCEALFGYGPRRLTRVLRLGRVLERSRTGRSLAGIAADCGYADQAHLSRDVRELAGTTPSRLLAELLG